MKSKNLRRTTLCTAMLMASLAPASAVFAQAAPAVTPAVAPVDTAKLKAQNDAFEALAAKLQQESTGTAEEDVRKLMELAASTGRPSAANVVMKSYLGRNPRATPAILLMAADNAARASDLRTAVTRYKSYLQQAQPSPQSSAAYARLAGISIDLLSEVDDAYDTVNRLGEKFRQAPAARRFDSWLLAEARRRNDYAAAANRLALILSEKLPLEQERTLYGEDLDWLLTAMTRFDPRQADALLGLKKIAASIRDNPQRTQRASLLAAHLEFRTTTAGKDAVEIAKQFDKVVSVAMEYLMAFPTAATLEEITNICINVDGNVPEENVLRRRKLFAAGFDRLPDPQKALALAWACNNSGQFATPDQWNALLIKFPAAFANLPGPANVAGLRDINFSSAPADLTQIDKLAPALAGVPSMPAAVINTLAQGDLATKGAAYYIQRESWHQQSFPQIHQFLIGPIWNTFSNLPANKDKPTGQPAYYWTMLANQGTDLIAKSPIVLFDRETLKNYTTAVFTYSGSTPDDKSKVGALLKQLLWIPLTDNQRKEAFSPVHDEFKRWADNVRQRVQQNRRTAEQAKATVADLTNKLADAAAKKKPDAEQAQIVAAKQKAEVDMAGPIEALKAIEAIAAQIAPLEADIKTMLDGKGIDTSKAPDALTRALAQCVEAIAAKNRDAYLAAARQAYALVREFESKKTPFAMGTIEFLLTPRPATFDVYDLQLEVLADQLKFIGPKGPSRELQRIVTLTASSRGGLGNYQKQHQEGGKRLTAVLGQALSEQADKGQLSPTLFNWFRQSRTGQGWNDYSLNTEVFAKLLEKKLLPNPAVTFNAPSAVVSTMWLINSEFPALVAQYPLQTFFEDLYLQETLRTGQPDMHYFGLSNDTKKKVIDTLTDKLLTQWQTLPLGFDARAANTRQWMLSLHIRALQSATPAVRDAWLAKVDQWAGQSRFDEFADGRASLVTGSPDITKPEGRAAYFAKLDQITQRCAQRPARPTPVSFASWVNLPVRRFSDTELTSVLAYVNTSGVSNWPGEGGYVTLAMDLAASLRAAGRIDDLMTLAPWFWKVARDTRNPDYQRALVQMAREFSDREQHELALALSSAGTEVLGADLVQESRTALTSVRSRSLAFTGGAVAVPRSDPRYAIFASQADFLAGRVGPAWDGYLANAQLAINHIRDLDPGYVIWLIGQNTDSRRHDVAKQLADLLLLWIDSSPTGFDPEVRASAVLSYGNLLFGKQEYTRAKAQFELVVAPPEFANTQARREAEIRIAETDRVTRQFDKASERLSRLLRRQDRFLQIEGNYQMALLKFDQEDFAESAEYLDRVFSLSPGHVNGRILEGKLQLKLNRLVEATEVKVGLSAEQRSIVPGRPLKVDLEDRNLSVAGAGGTLEVRAWTDNGDEETVPLLPFGDSKTKFSAQIPTKLGLPAKGDRVLQVLGSSTVYYELSTKGKARTGPRDGTSALWLKVASDSEMVASSGKILSREEAEERELERKLRQQLRMNAAGPETDKSLSTERADDEIRPGNPIFVRVTNPAQSIDPKGSTVNVRIATSSGDAIGAFPLKETAPFTGVFEGQVPTSSGQATATASDSDEGSEPNFVISPGDHPSWVGQPNSRKPKALSIDLNDSVPLGPMRIIADTPGRKLKAFNLQISPNGRDFTTIGTWPATQAKLWEGAAVVDIASCPNWVALRNYDELNKYMNVGAIQQGASIVSMALAGPNFVGSQQAHLLPLAQAAGVADARGYIARYRGAFVMAKPGVKSFEITRGGGTARYLIAVDGKAQGDFSKGGDKFSKSLASGVHVVEVFVVGNRAPGGQAGYQFTLQHDIAAEPYIAPATVAMFGPAVDPRVKETVIPGTATIGATADNTQFDVAFSGSGTSPIKARVVRLLINDFETDAPAIKRITLNRAPSAGEAVGAQVLPTKQDFMALRKDLVAQIAPGDEVTITYNNPAPVRADRRAQETKLTATFSDAQITACQVEYRIDSTGERIPEYVALRRFKSGEPINVFVRDADQDTSDSPDTIKIMARVGQGSPVELTALETEKHSGVFLAKIFPVSTAPQRAGEVQVALDQEVIVSYLDKENTNPGVPWLREFAIEQASPGVPELRVFEVATKPLELDAKAKPPVAVPLLSPEGRPLTETIIPSKQMTVTRPMTPNKADTIVQQPFDAPLVVEIISPELAVSSKSRAVLFVQTESGRKKAGKELTQPFDVTVPGTIRLEVTPGSSEFRTQTVGYVLNRVAASGGSGSEVALDQGRFTFAIARQLGTIAEVDPNEVENPDEKKPRILSMMGDDKVYLGLEYKDSSGQSKWVTQTIEFTADPFLDIMDRRYQTNLTAAHVGETLHLRVIDKTRDTTEERDTVPVELTTKSGKKVTVNLAETFAHSGIFKGRVNLSFATPAPPGTPGNSSGAAPASGKPPAGAPASADTADATTENSGAGTNEVTLPVEYGDKVTLAYASSNPATSQRKSVEIYQGADGAVIAFTKQFEDPTMAVRTQFAIAEAFFEQAKKHRELNQESLARRQIAQGRKLLEEAIRDYPNTELRRQADYLLANLSAEFAKDAVNADLKRQHLADALARFTELVASYPDSPYAPKAQYKKAVILQEMGQVDQAMEEYVKLSYRYPNNELVAETIARLGGYFTAKGRELDDKALNETDKLAQEKFRVQARDMHRISGQVFGRLGVRFPDHPLAGKTTVASANAFIRAQDFEKAVEIFNKIVTESKIDKDLIAQSMYWAGDCYVKLQDLPKAYRMFKRCTLDYPESTWARNARGRLTEDAMAAIDKDEKNN
jgi:tetratricopeptide (TPR) repeat protein